MPLISRNPSTGAVVGQVEPLPLSDVARVVSEARRALPAWRDRGVDGRAELLRPVAAAILADAPRLARLLSEEMGKPLNEALFEVRSVAHSWERELAEAHEAFADETLSDDRVTTTLRRVPYGVAVAITPWNFPFSVPHWMVFPALLAGNTVLFKPSEETPLIAAAYAEHLNRVLPAGVLQVVQGDGQQGAALVAAEVDLIAFTGSGATGRAILRESAHRLPKVLLELGGKDALIVLEDADVEAAARFAASNSFRNCGQVCVSTERILVASAIADAFQAALLARTAKLTVGDGLVPETRIGPMISQRQRSKVVDQVKQALASGSSLLCGGDDLDHDTLFLRPMVLTGVAPDAVVLTEETFGPVVVLQTFDSDEQAIAAANTHPLQLGAAVFGSADRARHVAQRLDAGMVGINGDLFGAAGSPWVGARQSGVGFHSGVEGHREFAQLRTLTTPH